MSVAVSPASSPLPTPSARRVALSLDDLARVTRAHAELCRAGAYPFVGFRAPERWHRRIVRTDEVDVWLISWLPTQATRLHDHGDSSGAFTVVSGALSELVPRRTRRGRVELRPAVRHAMTTTCFGPERVHDVVNRSTRPAVSVHAYSPPLAGMSYFDLADGRLRRTESIRTDDPEPI